MTKIFANHPEFLDNIARVCHEANRSYCHAFGDDRSQLPYDECASWQRESVLAGVLYALENPQVTAKELQLQWADHKRSRGWTYGAVKDPEKKTHPCLVPYGDLSDYERGKDILFLSVVRSFDGWRL